jgi:hypothetical protein
MRDLLGHSSWEAKFSLYEIVSKLDKCLAWKNNWGGYVGNQKCMIFENWKMAFKVPKYIRNWIYM